MCIFRKNNWVQKLIREAWHSYDSVSKLNNSANQNQLFPNDTLAGCFELNAQVLQ